MEKSENCCDFEKMLYDYIGVTIEYIRPTIFFVKTEFSLHLNFLWRISKLLPFSFHRCKNFPKLSLNLHIDTIGTLCIGEFKNFIKQIYHIAKCKFILKIIFFYARNLKYFKNILNIGKKFYLYISKKQLIHYFFLSVIKYSTLWYNK